MNKQIIKYGLRIIETQEILRYEMNNNSSGDNVLTTYVLSNSTDNIWTVDSIEHANYVKYNTTPWYNAGHDTPMNEYEPEELEIIKIVQEFNDIEQPNAPISNEEMIKYKGKKYNEKSETIEYQINEIKKHPNMQYSLYDYIEYCKNMKEKNLKDFIKDQ